MKNDKLHVGDESTNLSFFIGHFSFVIGVQRYFGHHCHEGISSMKRLVLPAFCGLLVLSTFSAAGTGPSKAKLEVFPQGIVMQDRREGRRVRISPREAHGRNVPLTGWTER